jgi:hypothetical protein
LPILDFQPKPLDGTNDGGALDGAAPLDLQLHLAHAMGHGLTGGVLGGLLGGNGGAHAGPQSHTTGSALADEVALYVGDGDLRGVDGGQHAGNTHGGVPSAHDAFGIEIFVKGSVPDIDI